MKIIKTDDLKGMTLAQVKDAYVKIKAKNEKLESGFYCHSCAKFLSASSFYKSDKTASGVIPTCKKCLYVVATDYDFKNKETRETKESIKKALKIMDLPYINDMYESSKHAIENDVSEKQRGTIFQQMVVCLQSLPQYKSTTWEDSEFDENDANEETVNTKRKASKTTKRRFGDGYSEKEYIWLEDEYNDFTTRYECKTKTQEILFKRICCKELEINNATRKGESTKDLDKSLQDLLSSSNLLPKQNSLDAFSDAQTLGTLIQKWENEDPIPECDPELADVDKIGQYIDVFFKGHLAKMVNLQNPLSHLYEKYMAKYTVHEPSYEETDDADDVFAKIFGKDIEDE